MFLLNIIVQLSTNKAALSHIFCSIFPLYELEKLLITRILTEFHLVIFQEAIPGLRSTERDIATFTVVHRLPHVSTWIPLVVIATYNTNTSSRPGDAGQNVLLHDTQLVRHV